jgi:uncharacterized phage protein gp47/JayE
MPFARPPLTALRNQAVQDITTSGVPGLTGLLRNAVLRVLAWCMAGLAYSVYGYADWIARMGVPFTALDEFLLAWAALVGVYPKPATSASGSAQFTGNPSVILPLGTALRRQDGPIYETTAEGSVDGTGTVTVTMTATDQGAFTNCDAGTAIAIMEGIEGINAAGLTVGPTTGGADSETQESLRSRMLLRYRSPPQGGAGTDYMEWALEVPGVTRAWTDGNAMGAGTVTVYPMFDLDNATNDGFPLGSNGVSHLETRPAGGVASGDQLTVADHIYPVQPVTALVYVVAPLPYPIDVTLQALDPNVQDIRDAISAAIADMLLIEGSPGGIVWPSQLYDAILAVPGIVHFTMSIPSAPVQLPTSHLPVMGTLTA